MHSRVVRLWTDRIVFLGNVFIEALPTACNSSFSGNLEKGGNSDKNCNISSFMISPKLMGCVYPYKITTTQKNVKVNPNPIQIDTWT
jgi:hypothetical protein